MKKIFALGIALLSIVLLSSCSKEGGASDNAAGSYSVLRTLNLRTPPSYPFSPVSHQVKLSIKAVNDNFVNITLPGVTYNLSGQEMVLPQITLKNIPVMDDGEGGVDIYHHEFNQKAGNKTVIGVIEGEVDADGTLELDVEFTYGSMPFSIIQEFESLK